MLTQNWWKPVWVFIVVGIIVHRYKFENENDSGFALFSLAVLLDF